MTFFDLKAAVAALEADARVHDNTTVVLQVKLPPCENHDFEPETHEIELAAAHVADHPRRIVLSDR